MASLNPDIKQSLIRDINNGIPVAEAGRKNRVAYHTAYMINRQLSRRKPQQAKPTKKPNYELAIKLLEAGIELLRS